MTVYEARLPNDMASLVRRIEALERQLQQAQAARRLEAATIGRGGIVIKGGAIVLLDSDSNEIGRMGIREDLQPAPDGTPQPGFILRRNDGSVAFTVDDPSPNSGVYKQYLKIQDAQGYVIFQENQTDGWGLNAPTFPANIMPFGDFSQWPWNNTASFVPIWTCQVPVWNPQLRIGGAAIMATGSSATGQIRLTINGAQFGSTYTTNTSSQTNLDWTVDLNTVSGIVPGHSIAISVEALANGGAGHCSASITWCYTEAH